MSPATLICEKTMFAWPINILSPLYNLPLTALALTRLRRSNSEAVELLGRPKAAPLVPTFHRAAPAPALLSVNPYWVASARPLEPVFSELVVANTLKAVAITCASALGLAPLNNLTNRAATWAFVLLARLLGFELVPP